MTENEAIKILAGDIMVLNIHNSPFIHKGNQAHKMAIQALEEIQQYRAIGTVEELQKLKGVITDFPIDCGSPISNVEEIWNQLKKYLAIGTIEELQALKETTVTQSDINAFKAYIDDCMDEVAFGNTDWNRSLALALKCMELHKLDWE